MLIQQIMCILFLYKIQFSSGKVGKYDIVNMMKLFWGHFEHSEYYFVVSQEKIDKVTNKKISRLAFLSHILV